MVGRADHLRSVGEGDEPQREADGGRRNGNGDITQHRLGELERRMGIVESKVDGLIVTCTEINGKLSDIASKSYVLQVFGVTAAILVLTLVGHLVIRSIGGGS